MNWNDPEFKRAYNKGYKAGARWPEHRPPYPPEPIVRQLMEALHELRDVADTQCATLDEDDEYVAAFEAPIQKSDDAMRAVSEWLLHTGYSGDD